MPFLLVTMTSYMVDLGPEQSVSWILDTVLQSQLVLVSVSICPGIRWWLFVPVDSRVTVPRLKRDTSKRL